MKVTKLILCFIATYFFTGCTNDYPLKQEQYDKSIYLIRAIDNELKNEYVNYAYDKDTVYISVGVSGSLPSGKNIRIQFEEMDEAIDNFNRLNLSASEIQYRHLPKEAYEYPETEAIIKTGMSSGTYPVYIKPEYLHCDSLYVLPIRIESVSDYKIRDNRDSVLLACISPVNNYSGDYYMDANITKEEDGSYSTYAMYRVAVATNKNTIRIYHESTENKQYLSSNAITLTINDDKTVTFKTWKDFNLLSGSGTYRADMKMVIFEYDHMNNGTKYKTKGFLYKRPKTEVEKEEIEDWIRRERDKDK